MRGTRFGISHAALAVFLTLAAGTPALGQRAGENAVAQADDAFGTSVGNEEIGLYTSSNVRGFSPTDAGNVRIEGLYFDQVAELNPRLQESSRIRVGIAAQGYAFPAPTGVVDYLLRKPGDTVQLTSLVNVSNHGAATLELDGATPLMDDKLSIGAGVGFNRNMFVGGASNYEHNEGVTARWRPAPGFEIMPFWSRSDVYVGKVWFTYVPNGSFLPSPFPAGRSDAPEWALNRRFLVNYGNIVRARLPAGLNLNIGIFRSEEKKLAQHYALLTGLDRQGVGDMTIYSDPPTSRRSTSGEIRLERAFEDGPRSHRAIFSLRMRDRNSLYDGFDSVDLGPVAINQRLHGTKPAFQYGPQTTDHVSQTTVGLTYEGLWRNVGQIGLGIQKSRYNKKTVVPGQAAVVSKDDPWLFDAALTGFISSDLAIFGSFTRGLEESGVAPQNASNRNEALPAIKTSQKDLGIRYNLYDGAKLVVALFDIQKPYLNLDASNRFGPLGDTQNRGVEFSLSGNITPRLDIVAGAVFSQPEVTGQAVDLGVVGKHPVGIAGRKIDLHLEWRPPGFEDGSLDMGVRHSGSVVATRNNLVSIPDYTMVDMGARYRFRLHDQPASLRLSATNIFNTRNYELAGAGAYKLYGRSGRLIETRLIVDL
ncbi:MAG: TonB-dependent receptor [Alphaproteobacteria bacterium]|nr:TonB-dependent receptor [Alphaproteobacteria bacterium]